MTDTIARTARQLGAAIRRQRRTLNLNQNELGDKAGLRQATISGLESGETGAQLRTLFSTLAALDLELVIRPRTRGSADKFEDLF